MNFRFSFLVLLALLGLRCVNSELLPVDYPEATMMSSVFISVNTVDGEPVADAVIRIGDYVEVTNEFGIGFFRDIQTGSRTYVEVEKDGFFSGSRRFYSNENQIHNVIITLVERVDVATFHSSLGGKVDFDASSFLVFPPDALETSLGGNYDGPVVVSGFMIYADDPELSVLMPGSLEARDENGTRGALSSYGMMIAELHSPDGLELQIKDGFTVDMTIGVPSALYANAPAEVPMWYFDEHMGEWTQDGTAFFNGTGYETEVSHFTPWNVDVFTLAITWNARFVDESGQPIPGLKVCLSDVEFLNQNCWLTNNSGLINAIVSANRPINLVVLGECGNALLSDEIGPYAEDATYGTTTISFITGEESVSRVSGYGLNCNEKPVTEGIALFTVGSTRYVAVLDPLDGTFSQNIRVCPTATPNVVVIDQATLLRSEPKQFSYAAESNLGYLWVCHALDDFITLEFEGFQGEYIFKQPTMKLIDGGEKIVISADDGTPSGRSISFEFDCMISGPCAVESYDGNLVLPNQQEVSFLDFQLAITEYGPVGGAISGRIYGTVNGGGNGQGGSGFTFFTGLFTVLRTE